MNPEKPEIPDKPDSPDSLEKLKHSNCEVLKKNLQETLTDCEKFHTFADDS